MKKLLRSLIFLGALFLIAPANAQTDDWKTELTNDGKIRVQSKVSEWTNKKGDTYPLIEYTAVSTEVLNYQSCILVMKNVAKHNTFLNVSMCEKAMTFSENEWLSYYVFTAPWPFSSTDCVVRVSFSEESKPRKAIFKMVAAPDLMKSTNLKRFELYSFTYIFKELDMNKIEITISAKMALTTTVPLFMLRASFPGSAAEPLEKLVKQIKGK